VNIIVWTGVLGVLAVIVVVACYIYWPSWRYSWKHARHVIQLTESEKTPAPEYGSMSMDAEEAWRQRTYEPFADDYSTNWRTQTFDSLSPETLDREAR
jgi:hypothetical protein